MKGKKKKKATSEALSLVVVWAEAGGTLRVLGVEEVGCSSFFPSFFAGFGFGVHGDFEGVCCC